jgi:hypothetical protein
MVQEQNFGLGLDWLEEPYDWILGNMKELSKVQANHKSPVTAWNVVRFSVLSGAYLKMVQEGNMELVAKVQTF